MIKDVRLGLKTRLGIKENHRGYPQDETIRIFGADTETVRGVPHTLQIVGPKLTKGPLAKTNELITRVNSRSIFKTLCEWVERRAILGGVNLVFFHNLNFDLRVIFHENLGEIYDQYNDIKIDKDGFTCKILFGRVNHAQIWRDYGGYICPVCIKTTGEPVPKEATDFIESDSGSQKRICTRHADKEPAVRRNLGCKLTLVDSAAFCPPGGKSLAAALKIYDVGTTKMATPKGLGEKRLWTRAFQRYALNDARAERGLGESIMRLHKEYDVTPCVSLPQLAARILRHHFFKRGQVIQFPPARVQHASELSYHAGKNGFYVKRGVYENVYEYDINSAFPKAMRELPQLSNGSFRAVSAYRAGRLGVYKISGLCHGATVPAIFRHDFTPIKNGRFKGVWVTGFEIECLRQSRDYQFKIERGHVWVPDRGEHHSPIGAFVDRFWKLKSTAPKGPKRDTYKNILNSLYGKFAACVEHRPVVNTAFGKLTVNDPLQRGWFEAGMLYNPFIATQITGYVRRELYQWEMKGDALHAATDSIKSVKKLPTSNELGGLKLEVFGRCYLFRTKLYLHFAKDNSLCGHDLKNGWIRDRRSGDTLHGLFDGPDRQHLCKWALHGFKGTVRELFRERHKLLRDGTLEYTYPHMVSLREGFRRDEPVSTMIDRRERLQLPALN